MNTGFTNPEQRNGYLLAGKVTLDGSGAGTIEIHSGDFREKAVLLGLTQFDEVTLAIEVAPIAYNSTTRVTSWALTGDADAVLNYSAFVFTDGIPDNSHLNYPNKQDY